MREGSQNLYNTNREKGIGLGKEDWLGFSLCTVPWLGDNVSIFEPERKANSTSFQDICPLVHIFFIFSLSSTTKTQTHSS